MMKFVAKRVLFRNGERQSVLSRPGGLPVQEATLYLARCLVSCDHIPRRSMALFRAKAVLDELIAGLPPRSPHQLQQIA
jgi:hypothetical protein